MTTSNSKLPETPASKPISELLQASGWLVVLLLLCVGAWWLFFEAETPQKPETRTSALNKKKHHVKPKRSVAGARTRIRGLKGAYMRWIPPGSFTMGSPKSEKGRDKDEGPQRVVRLTRGFWMMETEVTQAQYEQIMGNNPSYFKNCGGNCPVEKVNWHEAMAFAEKLSQKQGLQICGTQRDGYLNCKGWRLPTEAEWEYAARAGTKTAIYTGPLVIKGERNAPVLDAIAWYGGNSKVTYAGGFDCSLWDQKQYPTKRCGPYPVGLKRANAWGLKDMLGNVYEWCYDEHKKYQRKATVDPLGPTTGANRVVRGGSWSSRAQWARAAVRTSWGPKHRDSSVGLRLVRSGY